MAKGQKRTSREAKKPKADKKKPAAPPGTVSSTFGKPKTAAPTLEQDRPAPRSTGPEAFGRDREHAP